MKIKSLIILFFLFIGYLQSIAQGDLLITQKRVVFEGKKQKEALDLVNIGKDTATYAISFINYNMNEDGSFTVIEKPDSEQMIAEPYLRIFPRKVTLAPGEPQIIMLQCRRKPDMKAGEYRSHLYFRAEKNLKPLGNRNKDTTSALSIKLVPIYGMAIPIIIRSGVGNVSTSLTNLKLETLQDTIQNLKLTINRTGNISIFGNFIINFISLQGKTYEIGKVKGIGVYTNINKRNIAIQLTNTLGVSYKNGKLKVQYISSDEKNFVVYAVGELEIK